MIDMGISNLQSVLQAFQHVGAEVRVTSQPDEVKLADTIILPGVGSFGDGMESLRKRNLVEALRRHALEKKKPLLGICLGMQLMADTSEEYGLHRGLGLIRGDVVKLKPAGPGCRIPNMGWCDVEIVNPRSLLFHNTRNGEAFYFAHSYYLECIDQEDRAAVIDSCGAITAAVERENLFGIQFHPEKSQEAGLNLIESFWKYVRKRSSLN